jgi:hypothetical protein
MTFSLIRSPEIVSRRLTGRNTKPPVRPTAEVQPSIATLVHVGMGDRANAALLANQIDNTPATIPLLYAPERERRHFGPPQTAAQKNCEDAAAAQALLSGYVWSVQKHLGLSDG